MRSEFKSVVTVICLALISAAGTVLTTSTITAQGSGAWKPLFNGKDFTGWTAVGGGGRGRAGAPAPATPPAPPSTNPAERGWKIENGVITSTAPAEGQRSGSLATVDKFKDVELEFDFMLAEAGTKCTPKLGENQANLSEDKTCTFNSGVTLRNAYQLNLGPPRSRRIHRHRRPSHDAGSHSRQRGLAVVRRLWQQARLSAGLRPVPDGPQEGRLESRAHLVQGHRISRHG